MATVLSYLGIQIAACKCTTGIGVTCVPEKWEKARLLLDQLEAELATSDLLQYKPLERLWGVFVHIAKTPDKVCPALYTSLMMFRHYKDCLLC
jgi:hypothetical protein